MYVETSKSAHIFIIICYALFWLLKICFNYVLNKFTHFHVVSFKICACALMRHFCKACKNFGKARCLWCAEKLFWFIAKILDFVIYMGILLGPDKYDNALIWISLHLNMLLIINLVLMPTNDNEARSESTNHSVPPPLRVWWCRRQHTNKSTQQVAGNIN